MTSNRWLWPCLGTVVCFYMLAQRTQLPPESASLSCCHRIVCSDDVLCFEEFKFVKSWNKSACVFHTGKRERSVMGPHGRQESISICE